ncbi:MAG: hypothetical protein QXP68_06055 [Thermosphaera sp.]
MKCKLSYDELGIFIFIEKVVNKVSIERLRDIKENGRVCISHGRVKKSNCLTDGPSESFNERVVVF